MDSVVKELFYKGTNLQRHYRKMGQQSKLPLPFWTTVKPIYPFRVTVKTITPFWATVIENYHPLLGQKKIITPFWATVRNITPFLGQSQN